MKFKFFSGALFLFFLNLNTQAKVVLSSVLVLQRSKEVAMRGTSDTKKQIAIVTSWNGKSYKVDPSSGNWRVKVATIN